MKSYIRRYLPYDYWNRSTGNRADSISDCGIDFHSGKERSFQQQSCAEIHYCPLSPHFEYAAHTMNTAGPI